MHHTCQHNTPRTLMQEQYNNHIGISEFINAQGNNIDFLQNAITSNKTSTWR